jgi:hypothetical protein
MSDQWHLLQEGQQYGPYSGDQLVEFAKEGRIVRESMVWAEGMADWVAASQVEGLFPPEPAPVAAVPAWAPPGAQQPAWMRGGSLQAARPAPKGVRQSPLLGRQVAEVGGNYPPVEAKGASFGLLASLLGGGFGLFLLVAILMGSGMVKSETLQGPQVALLIVLMSLGGLGIVVAAVLQYVYLARVWSYLRFGNPRTTPGKAVGFLFIPFFNYYWLFVAFYGLAQDWNRITSQYADLQRAPKLAEGVFLTFCIGSLAFPPLALIMWFMVMSKICQAINFMAFRPVHRHGTIQFG